MMADIVGWLVVVSWIVCFILGGRPDKSGGKNERNKKYDNDSK